MSAANNPRRANSARRNAARKAVAARRAPCWICGLPIDYSMQAGRPEAFEADEIVPVSKGGSPFDIRNMAAAHRCCNQWRGDKSAAEVSAARRALEDAGVRWSSPLEFAEAARKLVKRSASRAKRALCISASLHSGVRR